MILSSRVEEIQNKYMISLFVPSRPTPLVLLTLQWPFPQQIDGEDYPFPIGKNHFSNSGAVPIQ